jgi:hypothetical protein
MANKKDDNKNSEFLMAQLIWEQKNRKEKKK